jgi:hypothetical protein
MISLLDLPNPQTVATVRRVVLSEYTTRHKIKPTRRSTPITLGSKSKVIINPTIKDVEHKVSPDDENVFKTTKKVSKSEKEIY